jgi:hypothetical protein
MSKAKNRPFGAVDVNKDHFLLVQTSPSKGDCRLYSVFFTPRGHERRLISEIGSNIWKTISQQAAAELASGMDQEEKNDRPLKFVNGENVLSPLPGRELAVLLWAIIEDDTCESTYEICRGWQSLAREERWWLYVKASAPGQKKGMGWRRSLYFALGGPPVKAYPDMVPSPPRQKRNKNKSSKVKKKAGLKQMTLF